MHERSPLGVGRCLDAIIAEHWVQVQLWPEGKPRTIAKPRLDAPADILRAIVYEIYS